MRRRFLVDAGIDSISVVPKALSGALRRIAEQESGRLGATRRA